MQTKINIDQDTVRAILKKSSNKLSGLELLILYLRIEKSYTLKEISLKICISHEMVRLHLKKIYSIIKEDIKNGNR